MRERLLIPGLWCLLITNAWCQTIPPILTVSKYKEGIYRSYSEFLQNSPSITDRFSYHTYSSERKVSRDEATYRLVLIDSAFKRREMKKLWGFSDGENVFVNEVMISGKLQFRKFQGLGRYCFLFASPPSQHIPIYPSAEFAAAAVATSVVRAIDGDEPYVLNVNNGKFFLLNKKVLITILEKDENLLVQFQMDEKKRKETTFIDYIQLYNQRHLQEANAELWYEREVIIYRPRKKELPEPVQLVINDTLTLSLKPSSIQRLKLEGESAKICSDNECTTIRLIRKGPNYISASRKKVGASAAIRKADEREGLYQTEEIAKSEE